jgi:arylsulfatase
MSHSNRSMIDRLGSPSTCNDYPTGRAVAFSTPYRRFKRYSSYVGGISLGRLSEWKKRAWFAMGAA